jgi:ribosomal-protein-alanine N-acetyltransferase
MSLDQREDILTPRLALIAITPAMLRSEQAQDNQLGLLTQAVVPPQWPPAEWEPHVFDVLLAQYERFPGQIACHRYVALLNADATRTLIGTLGAFCRESSPHEVEIGYSILPAWQGKGLATEGTRALLGLIRNHPGITSVVAHTFPHLTASIRVMEKCGFQFEGPGEEAGTVRYRLRI